jgi:hypothetical protein
MCKYLHLMAPCSSGEQFLAHRMIKHQWQLTVPSLRHSRYAPEACSHQDVQPTYRSVILTTCTRKTDFVSLTLARGGQQPCW